MKSLPELIVREVLNPFYLFQVFNAFNYRFVLDILVQLVVLGDVLLLRWVLGWIVHNCTGRRSVRHHFQLEEHTGAGSLQLFCQGPAWGQRE